MITVLMAVSLGGCGASLNVDTQGSGLTAAERPAATDTAPATAAATTPATDAKVVTGSTVKTAAATTTPAKAGDAPGPPPASAAKAAEALTAVATPGNEGYKIGPQDVVEVSVFKAPELSKSVQVADTGTINMPLLGEVPAAGRTAQEVERDLAAKLGAKYLQKPQVTVFVKEYNSQRVTLEGAVKKPGVYPVRGRMTLLQLVATAEGFGDTAEQTVVVFRNSNGKRSAARFDVAEIRSGAIQDPVILSGDVIIAPTSAMKEAYGTFLKALPLASVFALL